MEVPEGTSIHGSRFLDELGNVGRRPQRQSRLVARSYRGQGSATIRTKSPKVIRASQRILISLEASLSDMVTISRDVTKAYIQSSFPLERRLYITAPAEL